MHNEHYVLVLTGLGDATEPLRALSAHWSLFGLYPIIYAVGWHDAENFETKLKKMSAIVDSLSKNGDKVSVVGNSAGGSAALNLFQARKQKISAVVNNCGRLRKGPLTGFRSFAAKTARSQSFAQSVTLFEQYEEKLTLADKKRIITVRPIFGDELVPTSTTTIEGATNVRLPFGEHMLTISVALLGPIPLLLSTSNP